MKRFIILSIQLSVFTAVCLAPANLFAQKSKTFRQAAKAVMGKHPIPARNLPAALPNIEKAAQQAASAQPFIKAAAKAAQQAVVKDIRLSVAKLQSAALDGVPEKYQPTATAFVFKTRYNGKEEVWAATAGHIAKGMGEHLKLVFYENNRKIVLPARVVQYGPNMVSDIALLELQGPLPPEINPLPLAQTESALGEAFISAGYSGQELVYTSRQFLQKDNQRFLRTDYSVPLNKRAGLCGAPLINAQGEAVGVHCGSNWGHEIGYASNIKLLSYLLRAQHGEPTDIPLIAGKYVLGNILPGEHIHSVEALDAQGRSIARYDTENRLTQSTMVNLLNLPETHFLRLMLENRGKKPMEFNMNNEFRYLIYDKKANMHSYSPIHW